MDHRVAPAAGPDEQCLAPLHAFQHIRPENAPFGIVPDCVLTNPSEHPVEKVLAAAQGVKTTYDSLLTGRSTWPEMNPGILSTSPARSRNLCSNIGVFPFDVDTIGYRYHAASCSVIC